MKIFARTSSRPKSSKPRKKRWRGWRWLFAFILLAIPAAIVVAVLSFYAVWAQTFDLKRLGTMPERNTVFDVDGKIYSRLAGANRLKGGLKQGWTLNHKTGTGQELGKAQAGYNDIGILTAPDGQSYAVAVMIKLTDLPLPVRMKLMNKVVRATIAQHDMTNAPNASIR